MANDDKPPKKKSSDAMGRGKTTKAPNERPFDMWLQKQLHAMYDEIASEPLPGDLLNLIDRDAAESDEDPGSPGPGGKKS